jgi:hypothetical protein
MDTKSKYTLVNGTLYEGKKKAVLEVGNLEQIDYLSKYAELKDFALRSGIILTVKIDDSTGNLYASFTCVCSTGTIKFESEKLVGDNASCPVCGLNYFVKKNSKKQYLAKLNLKKDEQ